MMVKTTRYSPREISDYILRRLSSEKKETGKRPGKSMKGLAGERKANAADEKTPRKPYAVENALREIDDLISEKRDLLKQIVSDQNIPGTDGKYVTQDDVLHILDDLESMDNVDARTLTGMIGPKQGFKSTLRLAKQRLTEIASRIDYLSANEEITRAYRDRATKRIGVIRSARNVEGLQRLVEKAQIAKLELLARRNNEHASLTKADAETIKKYDLIQRKAQEKIDVFMGNDEIYYETKRRRLLEFRRQLLNDGFVETDSIKKTMLDIVSHLQLGIPVLLRGHLGVGKTEIALHASWKNFGVEPEFISGSEEATKYDIYGKTQIGIRSEEDKVREFRRRMDEYRRLNPDKDRKTLEKVEKQYYQTIVVQGITTSFFQYGPLVRAVRHGKPLLIDEMEVSPIPSSCGLTIS
jgi:MoxR-like ATPase